MTKPHPRLTLIGADGERVVDLYRDTVADTAAASTHRDRGGGLATPLARARRLFTETMTGDRRMPGPAMSHENAGFP